ncbi:MAG: NUDIX hydrolase [Parcubacteria group bacterium]|jgi:8-oxo-dGTP diphosphatase
MDNKVKKEKMIICRDIKGKKLEYPLSKLNWRPSIYGVIVENDKVLLSKQWDGYDFPGGGIDLGETLEEALKREVWEETGVKVKILDLITCEYDFFKLPHEDGCVQSILIYYLCKKIGGKISMDNFDEHEKKYADMPEWVDLKKARKIKFYNPVNSVEIIKKALKLCQK